MLVILLETDNKQVQLTLLDILSPILNGLGVLPVPTPSGESMMLTPQTLHPPPLSPTKLQLAQSLLEPLLPIWSSQLLRT
jgi:hypothetical protein